MLTKIAVTLAVIVIVSLVFKNKRPDLPRQQAETDGEQKSGMKSQTIAYIIVGAIVLTGLLFWILDYRDDRRVMDIRITNPGTGKVESYQAYQMDIKGKTFITLDGRQVTIGDSERFEILAH